MSRLSFFCSPSLNAPRYTSPVRRSTSSPDGMIKLCIVLGAIAMAVMVCCGVGGAIAPVVIFDDVLSPNMLDDVSSPDEEASALDAADGHVPSAQDAMNGFAALLAREGVAWAEHAHTVDNQHDIFPSHLFSKEVLEEENGNHLAVALLEAAAAASEEERVEWAIKQMSTRELADGTRVFDQGELWLTFIRDEEDRGHGFLFVLSLDGLDTTGAHPVVSSMQLKHVHRATPTSPLESGWPEAMLSRGEGMMNDLQKTEEMFNKMARAYRRADSCQNSFLPYHNRLRAHLGNTKRQVPDAFWEGVKVTCEALARNSQELIAGGISQMSMTTTTDVVMACFELRQWAAGDSVRRRYTITYGEESADGIRLTLTRPIGSPPGGGSEAPRVDAISTWRVEGRMKQQTNFEISAPYFASHGVLHVKER